MSRVTPIMAQTALPEGVKRATVSQEVIRRMKNTSRELPPHHIEKIIEEYMSDLKRGGFTKTWILDTTEAGVKGYIKMAELELKGEGYINRPEKSTRVMRRYKKLCPNNWFKPKPESALTSKSHTPIPNLKRRADSAPPLPLRKSKKLTLVQNA